MVEAKKLNIIKVIMSIDNAQALDQLEEQVIQLKRQTEQPDIAAAIRPIRKNVTLEQIVEEQNYKPISYQEFRKKADEIEWEEPLEELLGMLTK